MSEYVGLDVSLEGTSVCILDDSGRVMLERTVVTDPESIARLIRAKARRVNRVGLDSCRCGCVMNYVGWTCRWCVWMRDRPMRHFRFAR